MEVQDNQRSKPEHVELSQVERAIVNKPLWLERAVTAAQKVEAGHEDAFSDALKLFKEVRSEIGKTPSNLIAGGQTLVFADGERHVNEPLDNQASMNLDKILKISRGQATYDSDIENKAPVRHMTTDSKIEASAPGLTK